MPEDFISGIMDEYDAKCTLYTEFTKVTEQLIRDLLKANSLRVHSITSRIKERPNLKDKLHKTDSAYEKLGDVTDVSGIRIITYFADEVNYIASVINTEFEIDPDNSVDKGATLDPDRFGYLSLHYVAKLTPSRLKLTEYRQFSECNVEIQIRSILQHTWAEIEHDIGYKNKISIPRQLQRRFFQLAGHLELADELFTQLRSQIAEYEVTVSDMVSTSPNAVLIDQASLSAFMSKSELVPELDKRISNATNNNFVPRSMASALVSRLVYAGFNTIDEINLSLAEYTDIIVPFSIKILGVQEERKGEVGSGISLFYLSYIAIARTLNITQVREFLEKVIPDHTIEQNQKFANELIKHYKEVSS